MFADVIKRQLAPALARSQAGELQEAEKRKTNDNSSVFEKIPYMWRDAQDYDLAEWLLKQGASVHIEAGGMTPAYSEFHLKKYKPGSPMYNKVLHLKQMMQERGAVFPAQTPAEVLAKREKR